MPITGIGGSAAADPVAELVDALEAATTALTTAQTQAIGTSAAMALVLGS